MFSEGLLPQEFADLCGVGKDTLLCYDTIGLFHPAYIAPAYIAPAYIAPAYIAATEAAERKRGGDPHLYEV